MPPAASDLQSLTMFAISRAAPLILASLAATVAATDSASPPVDICWPDGADDGVDDNHDHDLHDVGDWTKNGQWLSISIRYCLVKVSDRNWDMMMMVVVVITMVMMMMTVLVVVIIIAMIIMKLATGPKMVSGYLTVHSRQLPGPPTLVPMSQLQIIPFSLFVFFHCLYV